MNQGIDLSAGLVQKPAATPAPAQSDDAGAGMDLSGGMTQKPADVYHIDEGDKGALSGVQRTLGNLAGMPASIWSAFAKPPKDLDEEMSMYTTAAMHHVPPRLALAMNRLIMDPMIQQGEIADKYEAEHKKLSPEEQENEKGFFNSTSNFHKANMHRIASIVPLLGPAAANVVEHYVQGDKSGAVAELLSTIGTGAAIHSAGKIAGKVGPKVASVAGKEIPVLASQAGSGLGSVTESLSKTIGKAGESQINKFVDTQRTAAEGALSNVAKQTAGEAAGKLDSATNPLTMSTDDFKKLTNSKKILEQSSDFGEAAERLKAAAKPHFDMIDQATDGEFSRLRDERSQLYKNLSSRDTTPADAQDIKTKIADVAKREAKMFDDAGVTEDDKGALGAARKAWAQASGLEELNARIKAATTAGVEKGTPPLRTASGEPIDQLVKAIKGKKLLQQLDDMDPKQLKAALGGNQGHIDSLRNLGSIMSTGESAAKMGTVLKFLRASRVAGIFNHPVAVASTEAMSYALAKILTNAKAAKAMSNGLKVNASAPVIANGIAQAFQPESTQ